MAHSMQYAFPAQAAYPMARKEEKKIVRKAQKEITQTISAEDMEIIHALEAVKSDMSYLHNCFDQVTDETLTDALIYELKAAGLKHKYFHNLLKEKGIVYGQ